MSNHRRDRLVSSLERLTAEFLQRQAGAQSIITVTGFNLSTDGRQAIVLISVYPNQKEAAALDFANRQTAELQDYIREHLKIRLLPFFRFVIDEGEKHRQKVEELLK